MSDKPLPCPFCGSDHITWRELSGPDGSIDEYRECWECGARGPSSADSLRAWNIRNKEVWKKFREE